MIHYGQCAFKLFEFIILTVLSLVNNQNSSLNKLIYGWNYEASIRDLFCVAGNWNRCTSFVFKSVKERS